MLLTRTDEETVLKMSHTNNAVRQFMDTIQLSCTTSGFSGQVRQIWRGPVSTTPRLETRLHQREFAKARAHETASMHIHRRRHAKHANRRRIGELPARVFQPSCRRTGQPRHSSGPCLQRSDNQATPDSCHEVRAFGLLVPLGSGKDCPVRVCSVGLWQGVGGSGPAEGDLEFRMNGETSGAQGNRLVCGRLAKQ